MKKMLAAVMLAALACTGSVWAASEAAGPVPAAVAGEKETQQVYGLDLDTADYTTEIMSYKGEKIAFRAYENKVYVAHPLSPVYQSMNIYVPEAYFDGRTVNGYTAATAPIFLPNTVGGYMPGRAGAPSEQDSRSGGPNAILTALAKGYVVAAPGARGRTSQDAAGAYNGKAPAFIVDMKAAVRYLRHNKGVLPGDTEKIIANGTSAGGALSALLGATGNSKEYEPYLKKLGAAEERDDIYAASVYCPITDLEHADMAYEWVFSEVHTYHQGQAAAMPGVMTAGDTLVPLGPGPVIASADGSDANDGNRIVMNRPANAPVENTAGTELTDDQVRAAAALKNQFPAYVNSLGLHDRQGTPLTLEKDGTGTFADYIKAIYMASAQKALEAGADMSDVSWAVIRNGKVTDMDLGAYAQWASRLKGVPAFDAFDLSTGENDEFGDIHNNPKHFTTFSYSRHTGKHRAMADIKTIRLMNPLYYIGQQDVQTAPYWRIRHGVKDRDTSLAVPAILALKLQNNGYFVDFAAPWGQGHGGDYDLAELFDWMDQICKNNQ